MKIKKFIKKKNNQYELVLESEKSIILYEETILKYDLLLKKEILNKLSEEIFHYNNSIEAYYLALNYIKRKLRTKKELIIFLENKNYSTDSIEFVCEKISKLGYLNEELYISSFINDKLKLTNDGKNKIIYELSLLVDNIAIVNKELEKYDNDFWIDRINRVINKKINGNKDSNRLFINKMKQNLIKLGYENTLINIALKSISIDDTKNFELQANKTWNSLIRKGEGDYKSKFYNKMYLKGFNSELINEFIKNNEN